MPIATSVPVLLRRRRDESPEQLLARFRQSGLTQRAFCEQTGIPVSTLQWRLARARREAAAVPPVTFAEIPVTTITASTIRDPEWAVEIVTATGVTVRLREALGRNAVRALLRGARC